MSHVGAGTDSTTAAYARLKSSKTLTKMMSILKQRKRAVFVVLVFVFFAVLMVLRSEFDLPITIIARKSSPTELSETTPTSLVKHNSTALPTYQILYYTRHTGTFDDFLCFTDQYANVNVTRHNPATYAGFGAKFEEFQTLSQNPVFSEWVSSFDVIVVSDTIPDAMPFLLLFNDSYPTGEYYCHLVLSVEL